MYPFLHLNNDHFHFARLGTAIAIVTCGINLHNNHTLILVSGSSASSPAFPTTAVAEVTCTSAVCSVCLRAVCSSGAVPDHGNKKIKSKLADCSKYPAIKIVYFHFDALTNAVYINIFTSKQHYM